MKKPNSGWFHALILRLRSRSGLWATVSTLCCAGAKPRLSRNSMTLPHTPSQTAGPYLHIGMTNWRSRARIAEPEARGEHIHLECRVLDGEGTPITDAMIEIWQANADGKYSHPEDVQAKLDDPACR